MGNQEELVPEKSSPQLALADAPSIGNRRLAHSLPLAWLCGPCLRFAQAIPFAVSRTAQVSRLQNPRCVRGRAPHTLPVGRDPRVFQERDSASRSRRNLLYGSANSY